MEKKVAKRPQCSEKTWVEFFMGWVGGGRAPTLVTPPVGAHAITSL